MNQKSPELELLTVFAHEADPLVGLGVQLLWVSSTHRGFLISGN